MASPGAIVGSVIGPSRDLLNSPTLFSLSAVNNGWCARHIALSTKDIKSIKVVWGSAVVPGTVTLRYETIDATTGKPTGTLYDANAVITGIVPGSAGSVSTYTFSTLPITGRTVGTAYGAVFLVTGASTYSGLNSHLVSTPSVYPICVLTATDGSTRSNFAEVSSANPTLSLVLEDDTEETEGMSPCAGGVANRNIFTTNAVAQKIILIRSEMVYGIISEKFTTIGTPAGDLQVRIFNSADAVVAGTTIVLDKDFIINAAAKGIAVMFPNPVKLVADVYRAVFDSAGSANSSNCFIIQSFKGLSSLVMPSAFRLSTTADVTAIPISWTDSSTDIASISLLVDSQPLGMLVHPGTGGGGG